MSILNPSKIQKEILQDQSSKKKKKFSFSDLSRIIIISGVVPLLIITFLTPILVIPSIIFGGLIIFVIEKIPLLKRLVLLK